MVTDKSFMELSKKPNTSRLHKTGGPISRSLSYNAIFCGHLIGHPSILAEIHYPLLVVTLSFFS